LLGKAVKCVKLVKPCFGKSQIAVKVREAGKARKVRKSNLPRKDREAGKDTKLTDEASMHWPRSHWPLGLSFNRAGQGDFCGKEGKPGKAVKTDIPKILQSIPLKG
jgi:hypothetical protein